ncbi:MAG: DUF4910 domain-containing protein [Rhodospirillaceae bacterium]|nr:DUF4910 domain-containing protein [Rhodospirillaceae bacterium]
MSEAVFDNGELIHAWARELFPINRSITGDGLRQTLKFISDKVGGMEIHEVPSGTPAFDWTVPDEWSVTEAYLEDDNGNRIVDFADNNLHLVGYSEPVDCWLELDELQPHLHSLPEQTLAIPYVTAYYHRTWGFCLTDTQRRQLRPGRYHAVVRSRIEPGSLSYGELVLPGTERSEILISSYACHPSMANNELSGPLVATALARWLQGMNARRYTYRFVFLPENIGSNVFLSRNHEYLREHVIAGFIPTCIGDERTYSMVASRRGDTFADRVARHVLRHYTPGFQEYSFLWPNRGSDIRNYCSPGIDLPVVDVMRSKYGTFPEYHTSLDDLDLVTPTGLSGGFAAMRHIVEVLERNRVYAPAIMGEPRLGPRGLYPKMNQKGDGYGRELTDLMNVIAYADGEHDLIALADRIGTGAITCADIADRLVDEGILTIADQAGHGPSSS